MKKTMLIALTVVSAAAFADQYVQGYTRQDGTYVAPHYRSNADHNTYNNYSSQGNVNPYTGQAGTVNPYQAQLQQMQQTQQYGNQQQYNSSYGQQQRRSW